MANPNKPHHTQSLIYYVSTAEWSRQAERRSTTRAKGERGTSERPERSEEPL